MKREGRDGMSKELFQVKPLKTKYSIPRASRFVMNRAVPLEKLERASSYLLTMLVAPVGYGKTTAVLHWIEEKDPRVAWLSLDGEDNDVGIFWQYVSVALDALSPGLSQRTAYALSSHELTAAGVHLRIILDRLSEMEDECFLILDNLSVIFNPAIFSDLTYLLKFSPSRMHFILIGRRDPDLNLAQLELSGELQKITAADLRFKEEEIARYFETRLLFLDDDMLREVASYTDGWAAALAAVALSFGEREGRRKVLAGMAGDHGNIGRYLLGTVFESYASEKRNFVMATSILDTLCPALCAAVTETEPTASILRQMNEDGEFLLLIDDDKEEYRYSPVFRDYAYRLLKAEGGDRIVFLHRRAARWFEQNGRDSEAVLHYLQGEAYDDALRLFEPRLGAMAGTNAYEKALFWINRLPPSYVEKCFGIALFYALYYTGQRRFDTGKYWLNHAVKLYRTNTPTYIKNPDVPLWLTAVNGAICEGDFGELVRLLESIPPEKRGAYRMNGTFDLNPADIFLHRSRINRYIRFAMERNGPWRSGMDEHPFMSVDAGYAYLVAGEYDYEHNRFETARPALLKAASAGEAAGCPGTLVPALTMLARIRKTGGDSRGALELLDRCDDLLQAMSQPHWHHSVDALRHRFLLEDGDTEAISSWLTATRLSVFTGIDSVREYELLVFVRVLLFFNRTDEAEQLLTRLAAFAEEEEKWHSSVEILNLFAILSWKLGERQNMVQYIDKSLKIGSREGYFRNFVDEGAALLPVLEPSLLPEPKEEKDQLFLFAASVARQIRKESKAAVKAQEKALATENLLTAKEREVLALLYNACSNKEIGQHLGISLRTVKTHTGNIYGKLGVLTRAQCIKYVRERGLFDK